MNFVLKVVLFLVLLVIPFVLVISPSESLKMVTWLSIPTWPLHGSAYSEQLFDLVKPNYTIALTLCMAVASSFSKIVFITLMVLTTIASFFSAFWLNYLINAA